MISSFPSWFTSAFSMFTGLANPPKDAFCSVESSDSKKPSFFSEGAILPMHKALGSLFFSNNKSTTAEGVFQVSVSFKFLSKERNLNLLSTNDLKNICSILNIKNYVIKKIKLLGFCTNLILIIYK